MARRQALRDTFHAIALAAAFQHGKVYSKRVTADDRARFQNGVREALEALEPQYSSPVSHARHVAVIEEFASSLSVRHGGVLRKGRMRIGVAQKAVNVYLKFAWLAGWIPAPPHCPFDARIIALLPHGLRSLKWTALDDIGKYEQLVEAARSLAGSRSLAAWELFEYNRLSTVAARARSSCPARRANRSNIR